jgi:hypothetical protein
MTFTWQRDPSGRVRRTEEPAHTVASASSDPYVDSAKAVPLNSLVGATPSIALPPAQVPWKFRERTTSWSDALTASLRNSVAAKDHPVVAAVVRLIQGALLHRDVYRTAARRPELNAEALCVAVCIIVAGFAALWMTGFGGWFSGISMGLMVRLVVVRIVGWGCAVFAIQVAAKALHQVELPATVWFRALIYAQAPALLSFVPAIGILCGLWIGFCTVAAVHDLTGRDTKAAVTLTVIGGVASGVGGYIATAVTG